MYIPVLRYRLAERGAFKTLSKINIFLPEKVIPLIEIVQHYPTGRVPSIQKSFEQVYTEEFQGSNFPIIIDIPLYIDLSVKKIEDKYKRFLEPNKLDIDVRLNYLLKLSKLPSVIPVVSYDPEDVNTINTLSHQENILRKNFVNGRLCYRIFGSSGKEAFTILNSLIMPDDILLLDLEGNNYHSKDILDLYEKLYKLRENKKCKIGIIDAPIPNNFSSSTIANNSIINKLDNSLLLSYKTLNFDIFGDYAGVKKDSLVESHRGQITNIYYCRKINKYIGFTAKPSIDPKDYALKIAPSIFTSVYWNNYSSEHHHTCPGCVEIFDKVNNTSHPGNRSTWKSISIEHYIYSVSEGL
jgi:hypothetical protein